MSTVLPFRTPATDSPRRPEPLLREALGEVLRSARTEQGDRLTDVAHRAGVSPQYLSEIERGRKDPSSEVLSAVSEAVGLALPTLARRAADHLAGTSGPVCLAA